MPLGEGVSATYGCFSKPIFLSWLVSCIYYPRLILSLFIPVPTDTVRFRFLYSTLHPGVWEPSKVHEGTWPASVICRSSFLFPRGKWHVDSNKNIFLFLYDVICIFITEGQGQSVPCTWTGRWWWLLQEFIPVSGPGLQEILAPVWQLYPYCVDNSICTPLILELLNIGPVHWHSSYQLLRVLYWMPE